MKVLTVILLKYVTVSWCQLLSNLDIISDLTPEHCFVQNLSYVETDTFGLPKCTTFNDTGNCTQYYNPENELYNVVYKPSCSKDGQMAAKQCKGEKRTGRCFCFSATGERIFGQQWWSQADDMTCACSRKKLELSNSLYFDSLHCDSMGNYEPLQCDILSGQCWCADPKTGALLSMVLPEKAKSMLPCYNALLVGSTYLRQCESQKFAREKIRHVFGLHGTVLHYEEFLCDGDGAWGAFSIIQGSAHCTWRDKSIIGAWQSGNDRTGINCNCARDTKIFAQANKEHIQKCSGNGNYEEFQKIGPHTYCVDKDGHRKTPSDVNIVDFTNCDQYTSYH